MCLFLFQKSFYFDAFFIRLSIVLSRLSVTCCGEYSLMPKIFSNYICLDVWMFDAMPPFLIKLFYAIGKSMPQYSGFT